MTATGEQATDGRDARRGRRRAILVAGLVLAVIVVAGVVWFLGRGGPAAVDLGAALEAADPDAGGLALEDVDGIWRVDPEVVDYDYDQGTGTFVGYRVDEELTTVGSTTAVGRTPSVEGSLTVEDGRLAAATVVADLTALRSDESFRDQRVRQAMQIAQLPEATFELSGPGQLAGMPDPGEPVMVDVEGQFTLHGVTRPVSIPLEAAIVGPETVVVTGSFEVVLADHEIEAPSAPIVLSVADTGTVEFQLYLTRD